MNLYQVWRHRKLHEPALLVKFGDEVAFIPYKYVTSEIEFKSCFLKHDEAMECIDRLEYINVRHDDEVCISTMYIDEEFRTKIR